MDDPWPKLLDAALLVAAANGIELAEAKDRLCAALCLGTVEHRAFRKVGLDKFKQFSVVIPGDLTSDSFDWPTSQPFARWEVAGWTSLCQIDLLLVSRAGILHELCPAPPEPKTGAAAGAANPHGRPRGTGYAAQDAPLVAEMSELTASGKAKSLKEAASIVIGKDGSKALGASVDAKIKRLVRRATGEKK